MDILIKCPTFCGTRWTEDFEPFDFLHGSADTPDPLCHILVEKSKPQTCFFQRRPSHVESAKHGFYSGRYSLTLKGPPMGILEKCVTSGHPTSTEKAIAMVWKGRWLETFVHCIFQTIHAALNGVEKHFQLHQGTIWHICKQEVCCTANSGVLSQKGKIVQFRIVQIHGTQE